MKLRLFSVFAFALLLAVCAGAPAALADGYQGFGAATPGGTGHDVVHVTNLNDSGAGSLRQALMRGKRIVVFDVGGEILLKKPIPIKGSFITLDGTTAPAPGITLKNQGLLIHGSKNAHDVIVRGIRIRNAAVDGIQISRKAYNIVIDGVSLSGSKDENIEVTNRSHDVTVSRSILAGNGKNILIKYAPSRVTLHHNIFAWTTTRNPQARIDNRGTKAIDTTLDMRNNLVWGWGNGYGTLIWYGPWANVVNNYYSAAGGDTVDTLTVCEGDCDNNNPRSAARAYVSGNLSADSLPEDINLEGNEPAPFPAPAVDTQDACPAAQIALAEAGARPLDSVDEGFLAAIALPPC